MYYYNVEDVNKLLLKHNITTKYGDLPEYWPPYIRIEQIFATGPRNVVVSLQNVNMLGGDLMLSATPLKYITTTYISTL